MGAHGTNSMSVPRTSLGTRDTNSRSVPRTSLGTRDTIGVAMAPVWGPLHYSRSDLRGRQEPVALTAGVARCY